MESLNKSIGTKDTFIIGKGKPFLNSSTDAERIARYTDAFWALVEDFRRDRTRAPGPQ